MDDKGLAEKFAALLNEWIEVLDVWRDGEGNVDWIEADFRKRADPDATLCEFTGDLMAFASSLCPEGYDVVVTTNGFSIQEDE